MPFAKKVFEWARLVNPSQPITSGWWNGDASFNPINEFILNESDVITFHAYCDEQCTKDNINLMKSINDIILEYNRPVICTEYMARPLNSKFITHLPIFKEN